MNKKETRTLISPIELRASDDNSDKRYVVGYALRFNSESENLGGFVEKIEPNALEGADMSDVRALFNHDPSQVLGRSKANTLKLSIDEFGLRYEIDMPDTTFARDLMNSMERGDIDQSSFAFMIDYENDGDSWEYDDSRDLYLRTIHKFRSISDVSIVTYPAYTATESIVAQRGLEDYKNELQNQILKRKLQLELELS